MHLLFYAGFWVAAYMFRTPAPLPSAVLGSLLVWISLVDTQRFEIPDSASVLLAASGLWFAWSDGVFMADHIGAALVWSLVFWGTGEGYARLRGFDGLGFGDVKLMVGIGLWLGFVQTTLVVFAAACAGILVLLTRSMLERAPPRTLATTAVAFGPFLCLSTWVIWLL